MLKKSIYGNILLRNTPPVIDFPSVSIGGECNDSRAYLSLNEEILSRHMMLIGGTGCGKTNTFFHIVDQIKRSMKENDVMIIFDTKEDYYKKFYNPRSDYVISTSPTFEDKAAVWNIFNEILLDGLNDRTVQENVSELSWGLFSEAVEKNTSNPFFPNAARDLFASILTCIIRFTDGKEDLIKRYLNNEFLRNKLDTMDASAIRSLLCDYSDQAAVMSYIGDGDNSQGMGVIAEMQTIIRKIFVGAFASKGDFSVRRFIRERGAKTLFIEYDLSRGATLTPIYKMLVDLALKEAMSRNSDSSKYGNEDERGNVYIFCDEFKLLPSLQHIEDAVNFGRSLGVKVVAGLQSIDQLYENYGEARGKNIIAGFSSVLSFKANDEDTRNFTVGLYGKNYISEQYRAINNSITEERRISSVVEDWDIISLKRGEAIIGLTDFPPFKFKFDKYR